MAVRVITEMNGVMFYQSVGQVVLEVSRAIQSASRKICEPNFQVFLGLV